MFIPRPIRSSKCPSAYSGCTNGIFPYVATQLKTFLPRHCDRLLGDWVIQDASVGSLQYTGSRKGGMVHATVPNKAVQLVGYRWALQMMYISAYQLNMYHSPIYTGPVTLVYINSPDADVTLEILIQRGPSACLADISIRITCNFFSVDFWM